MTDMTTVVDHTDETTHEETHHDAHGDTLTNETHIRGITLPLPLYTVVFGALALITIIEVVIAELPDGWLGTTLLVVLSISKAVLVVWFYMHLRSDNKLFALALLLPLFIALTATFFLLAVPTTGYGY